MAAASAAHDSFQKNEPLLMTLSESIDTDTMTAARIVNQTGERELADLIRGVLSELSTEFAALLTAKYLDDRSLEEMSQQFGSSVDAIKSKLARARREFRLKFADPFELQAQQSLPQRG